MSKNLTRKGLAFGALVALGASVIAGAPASAAGMTDKTYVSLAPRTGTEYTVLSDQFIDLTSNGASGISGTVGKNLKFLVTDPQSKLRVDAAATTDNATAYSPLTSLAVSGTTATLTVGAATLSSTDKVIVHSLSHAASAASYNGKVFDYASSTTATLTTAGTTATVTDGIAEETLGLNTRAALVAASLGAPLEVSSLASTITGETVTNNRTAAGSFVVDSGTYVNTAERLLRLVSSDATSTYSGTVTAWVDDNNNGAIDATEYTSETRTVTFQKAGDVTATTTMSPIAGDKVLTATIATTPTLNGQQVLAQNVNFLNAAFTRQGTAAVVYAEADKGTGSNQTVVWDDTAKTFAAVVDLDADASDEASVATGVQVADAWTGIAGANDHTGAGTADAAGEIVSIALAATNVVTVTTFAAHNLRSGDKITMVIAAGDSALEGAEETTAVAVSVTGEKTFTYSASETVAATAASSISLDAATDYTVATYATDHFSVADRVFAGTYTAQAAIETASETTWTAIGAKASVDTTSATSKYLDISTAATAAVQGKLFSAVGTNTTYVKTGTKTVDVTIAVTDEDEDAVSAGRTVVVSISGAGDTFKVNGKSTSTTVVTDANGKVTVAITATNAYAGATLQVTALAENIATADIDLAWADAAFGVVDYSGTAGSLAGNQSVTRTVLKSGSYTLDLGVMDQFNTAADSAAYRFKTTGNGVTEGTKALVAGKASVTITDNLNATMTTYVALQKVSSAVWSDVATWTITTNIISTPGVVLGASGSTTYGSAVVTSAAVAEKALVEIDKRSSSTETPAYANNILLNGAAVNALTSVGTEGAVVTVSGASNILFENGQVTKKGSLTFVSGASGLFSVKAYSTTAQIDSVITFTSNGKTATIKVTFTGIGVGEGTALAVTAPATALPASTFQISAKLSDTYGNAVTATAGRVKVTHSGPGIVYGTLPTSTDANGALSFSVLLGAADVGNAVFTVSYDQNGDGDFVDAKDLTSAKTVVIGSASVLSVSASVAGIAGYVATTVRNASGKAVTVTVNGRVLTPRAPNVAAQLFRFRAKAGKTTVVVKVDGVTVSSRTVMVK